MRLFIVFSSFHAHFNSNQNHNTIHFHQLDTKRPLLVYPAIRNALILTLKLKKISFYTFVNKKAGRICFKLTIWLILHDDSNTSLVLLNHVLLQQLPVSHPFRPFPLPFFISPFPSPLPSPHFPFFSLATAKEGRKRSPVFVRICHVPLSGRLGLSRSPRCSQHSLASLSPPIPFLDELSLSTSPIFACFLTDCSGKLGNFERGMGHSLNFDLSQLFWPQLDSPTANYKSRHEWSKLLQKSRCFSLAIRH